MIHWGGNRTETRWIPFPRDVVTSDGTLAQQRTLRDTPVYEPIADDVLARAGPPYTKWLTEEGASERDELAFMRDKSILLIGQSDACQGPRPWSRRERRADLFRLPTFAIAVLDRIES